MTTIVNTTITASAMLGRDATAAAALVASDRRAVPVSADVDMVRAGAILPTEYL
jgi:hypothetical protein